MSSIHFTGESEGITKWECVCVCVYIQFYVLENSHYLKTRGSMLRIRNTNNFYFISNHLRLQHSCCQVNRLVFRPVRSHGLYCNNLIIHCEVSQCRIFQSYAGNDNTWPEVTNNNTCKVNSQCDIREEGPKSRDLNHPIADHLPPTWSSITNEIAPQKTG